MASSEAFHISDLLMTFAYRIAQFIRNLTARITFEDLEEADSYMPSEMHPLFRRMSISEQAHSLRVMRALISEGCTDSDVLAAGLLHDVGKIRHPLNIFERIVAVLVRRVFPKIIEREWEEQVKGWQRPFFVADCHPKWGAELVADAGGSKRLVELIRRHQEAVPSLPKTELERQLAALKAADEKN
jgi:hypothetical protein